MGINTGPEDTFLHCGGKKHVYTCDYCQRVISNQFRVQCAICEDFDLCGDCFAVGAEKYPHEASHDYRVIDCLEVPLFAPDWTTNEELLLLEGIDKCGVGNWKVIAEYINTNKTAKQLEEHYWEHYMGRHGKCLPPTVLGADKKPVDIESLNSVVLSKADIPLNSGHGWSYKRGEIVVRDDGIKQSSYAKQKDKDQIREKLSALPGSDLPGFIPLREDFDVEFENDAELILADMEFSPDDHPSEKELKLQVIKIYNRKLEERNKRKRYAIDRGFIDFKKQQSAERKRNKEERDLVAKLRVFARFHSPEEHEALVESILKARKLRQQILFFQQCRKMGLRTLDEARQYEIDRKKREQEMKAKKQREATPHLYAEEITRFAGNNSSSARRRAIDGEELMSLDYQSSRKKQTKRQESLEVEKGQTADIDVSTAAGAEFLSKAELDLCVQVPMLPTHFLAAKDGLVREAYRNGQLTLEGMRRVIRLEEQNEAKVFDFFVKEGNLGVLEKKSSAKKKKT